jgi:hypothetical protein
MKRFALVALVVALGLAVAAPAQASNGRPADAHIAKKCKKKRGKKKKCKKHTFTPAPAPVVTTPPAPPTPAPLTAAEIVQRVGQKAAAYCSADTDCVDSGYYYDSAPGDPACSSRTTFSATCYGWNEEFWPGDDPDTDYWLCDFREVIARSGINGISSHQDLSFGGDPWATGWDCFPEELL